MKLFEIFEAEEDGLVVVADAGVDTRPSIGFDDFAGVFLAEEECGRMPEDGVDIFIIALVNAWAVPDEVIRRVVLYRFIGREVAKACVSEEKLPAAGADALIQRQVAEEIEDIQSRFKGLFFQRIQCYLTTVRIPLVVKQHVFDRECFNALFGRFFKEEGARKHQRLVVAEEHLNIVLVHQPLQHFYAAVTIAVDDIAEDVQVVILAEPGFRQQLFEFFKRVTVQV